MKISMCVRYDKSLVHAVRTSLNDYIQIEIKTSSCTY